MTGAAARRASPDNGAAKIEHLQGQIDAHAAVDDHRFSTLTDGVKRVEGRLDKLTDDVRQIGEDVTDIKVAIASKPASEPGHFHMGPGAWAMVLVLISIIGWLLVTLYQQEPARIQRANSPMPVQVTK